MSDILKRLAFRQAYYHEPQARQALNAFASGIFGGLDFAPWNNLGLAFGEYTPFSFFEQGRVVANVSASPMNMVIADEPVAAIQIGTVASLPAYRKQGLVTALMRKADQYWRETHGFFFLFAHPAAQAFYRQFGYRGIPQYRFESAAPPFTAPPRRAVRLNPALPRDRDMLNALAAARTAVSARVGVQRQSWLVMFHASVVFPTDLYFIESLGVAIIRRTSGNTLRLIDVIGENIPTLKELFPFIGAPGIEKITYDFTPDLMDAPELSVTREADTELFVRGPFRIGDQPFVFPLTSQA